MIYSVCVDSVFGGKVEDKMFQDLSRINRGIEFWSWWDRDISVFENAVNKYQMKVWALCTPFIPLTDRTKREDFVRGLKKTIEVCKKLDCPTIIAQVGDALMLPRQEQHDSIVEGLKRCVPFLKESGVVLTIEPLNTKVDHRGYYLENSAEGFEIVEEVGSPFVKLLYDIYHMQIMEGDILSHMKENLSLIGHIHIAGVPGRHEVTENELNYEYILGELERSGYQRAVGLEYFPTSDAMEGLKRFFRTE